MKKSEKNLLNKINDINIDKKPLDLSKVNIDPNMKDIKEPKNFNFKFLIPLGVSLVLVMLVMSVNLKQTGGGNQFNQTLNPPGSSQVEVVDTLEKYFNKYGSSLTTESSLSQKINSEFIKIYDVASNDLQDSSDHIINKNQYSLFINLLKQGITKGDISITDLDLEDVTLDSSSSQNPEIGDLNSKPDSLAQIKYLYMLEVIEEYLE